MRARQSLVAYKAFSVDWKGRSGFQYSLGASYEHNGSVGVCEGGFHASEYPLDVLNYRAPVGIRLAIVEQSGRLSRHDRSNTPSWMTPDSTIASSRITIKTELDFGGLTKAAIDYTFSRATHLPQSLASASRGVAVATGSGAAGRASGDWDAATGDGGAGRATGDSGAASATGDWGAAWASGNGSAASATGRWSVAMASGDNGAASTTGERSAASATGNSGAATATGDWSAASASGVQGAASAAGSKSAASCSGYKAAASATGDASAASATGLMGAALVTGDRGIATATGYRGSASSSGNGGVASTSGDGGVASTSGDGGGASARGKAGVATACGRGGRAMAGEGCALFLVERDDNRNIVAVFAGIGGRDGIKADTWYELVDGKPTETCGVEDPAM